MRNSTLARFVALGIAASIALVGCGGQSTSTESNAGDAKTEATAAQTTEVDASASVAKGAEAEATPSRGEANADGALYSEDGVDIREVEVNLVGSSTFNLSVVFANNNDTNREFDCSKFQICKGGEVIQATTQTKTLDANQTYIQWAFPIREPGSLALGDTVTVSYGDVQIAEVTIDQF